MFAGEGGIARMMRLYLKALCETADPRSDTVTSVVLNDGEATDPRLARYSTPVLTRHVGCARKKGKFVREALHGARRSQRILCGHLHQSPIAWMAHKLNPRVPYYVVAHGIDVWRAYSPLEQRALKAARRVFCVSEFTRARVLENLPQLDASRLVVVPNALDPELGQAPGAAHQRDAAHSAHRILSVGRLTTVDVEKGFETLIDAMPAIRREIPDATLRIVGSGNDLARLQQRAVERGIGDACVFTGPIDDATLAREYEQCDVFALPSKKEGFGLVYLEAMIRGKACLGVRAGGVPEVINENVGALVGYGDAEAIARELVKLLRQPKDPQRIRQHAETFGFDAFKQRVAQHLGAPA
jgi:phosphatidyl-myo-inositol dimannoside synthase